MARNKEHNENLEEEVLKTIMVAIGFVLASKPGGRIDPPRDRECAVHVLSSLESDGFKIVINADRT